MQAQNSQREVAETHSLVFDCWPGFSWCQKWHFELVSSLIQFSPSKKHRQSFPSATGRSGSRNPGSCRALEKSTRLPLLTEIQRQSSHSRDGLEEAQTLTCCCHCSFPCLSQLLWHEDNPFYISIEKNGPSPVPWADIACGKNVSVSGNNRSSITTTEW